MSHQDAVNLHNELNRLSSVTDLRETFHDFVAKVEEPQQAPGEVTVDGDSIKITVLQHELIAESRPVKISSGYAIEYDFEVSFKEEMHSIWRMYLMKNGVLYKGTTTESPRFCDFDNRFIKLNLVIAATNALLHSVVFLPSPNSPT